MNSVKIYNAAPTAIWRFANPVSLVRNILSNRELLWQFAWRDAMGRYQGSQLGLIWSFLNPLLMVGVYMFVFTVALKVKWPTMVTDSFAEFAVIMFMGLILNNIFMECAGRAHTVIVSQPNFVKKVVFPLEILPAVATGSALIAASITLVLMSILAGIFLGASSPIHLLIFPVVLPAIFMSLGAGWLLSALDVFLREIGHFIHVFLQILTFMTPVFYPLSSVPERFRWITELHPNDGGRRKRAHGPAVAADA